MTFQINYLENTLKNYLIDEQSESDAAHDLAHIQRVVANTKSLAKSEVSDLEIVVAAAWLHDCVVLPKNHPEREKASTYAAEKALEFLVKTDFPADKLKQVSHAIEAHSFSAGITPETEEACIVQDADRLDALGAIGIARCFSVGGQLNIPVYHPKDPFCELRDPDDSQWTIDHFYKKLFQLPESMNTKAARKLANSRVEYMKGFLKQLSCEIR